MKKGKYGICLWFYATLAFVLACFEQTVLCGLVLAAAIFIEKDEWLNKQVIQAFSLCMLNTIVNDLFHYINFTRYLDVFTAPVKIMNILFNSFSGLITFVICIFAIIGIFRTAGGHDANIPLVNSLADRVLGYVKPKPQYQQPQQQYQQQPQPQYQQPQYQQPQYQQPQPPQQPPQQQ